MSKNLNHLPTTKKKVLTGLGIFLAFSYVAGMIQSWSVNPITIIRTMLQEGFPIGPFLLLIVAFAVLGAYFYLGNHKDGVEKDVLGRNFFRSTDKQAYGDAHFETPKEFEKIALVQPPERACGTILGQMDDSGRKLINQRMDRTRDNHNIMVIGASGSGKSFTFTKPFCYQAVKRRESVIITDPDGGLYRDMAKYFKEKGYVVRRFDLKNMNKSDGWDCMRTIEGPNIELNAQLFSHIAISNLPHGSEGIYFSAPLALLKACILRVMLGDDFPPEKKNIETVYSLIQNPGGEAYLDEIFDETTMPPNAMPSLGPYLSFKQSSPNLRGNIVTNLSVDLQLLQNKLVCKILSQDDIDMELPAKQPCAYFCVFPDNHDTNQFVVSLFFSMLFITLIDFADGTADGRCPVPVNFLLDEFPSIGVIPDFDKKMATIRKRGITATMILQDVTQLQNNYKTTWVTLMSNCATLVSLGVNDGETAQLLARRAGQTSVEVETERREAVTALTQVFHPKNIGVGKRDLLSYDEIFRVDEDAVVILAQKHNPIYAKKYPHTLHPDAKLQKPTLLDEIPDISDTKGRRKRKEEEDTYLANYLAQYPLDQVDRTYPYVEEPSQMDSITAQIKVILAKAIKTMCGIQTSEDVAAPWEEVETGTPDDIWFAVPEETYEEGSVALPEVASEGQTGQESPGTGDSPMPAQEASGQAEGAHAEAIQGVEKKDEPKPTKKAVIGPPPAQVLSKETEGFPAAMYESIGKRQSSTVREKDEEATQEDIVRQKMMAFDSRSRQKRRGGGMVFTGTPPASVKKPPIQATSYVVPPKKEESQ